MTYRFKESRSEQKIISNLNFLMPVMVYTSSFYITKHAKKHSSEKKKTGEIHGGENGENWGYYSHARRVMRQEGDLYLKAPKDTFTFCEGLLHVASYLGRKAGLRDSEHCTFTSPDQPTPPQFGSSGSSFITLNILHFFAINVV